MLVPVARKGGGGGISIIELYHRYSRGRRHIIIQIEEYNVLQKKSLGHRVNPTV